MTNFLDACSTEADACDVDHDACDKVRAHCAYGANTAFADTEWSRQGTPEALYFCWALTRSLGGEFHTEEFPENLKRVMARKKKPSELFQELCNSLLSLDDFNDEGNRFTATYHPAGFKQDLEKVFGHSDAAKLEDSWKAVNAIGKQIDEQLAEWRAKNPPGDKLVV